MNSSQPNKKRFCKYQKPRLDIFCFNYEDIIKTSLVCPTDDCPTHKVCFD